jgi:hypothetical protein
MTELEVGGVYKFDYVNYRGDRSWRTVRVLGFRFGSNQWHPEEQLLIEVHDLDRGLDRAFAASGIRQVIQ